MRYQFLPPDPSRRRFLQNTLGATGLLGLNALLPAYARPFRAQGGAGAELATAMAQATFVQMRRMFVLRIGADPPLVPTGDDVRSISEGCKVLAEARMYYELKRENKKLRF